MTRSCCGCGAVSVEDKELLVQIAHLYRANVVPRHVKGVCPAFPKATPVMPFVARTYTRIG